MDIVIRAAVIYAVVFIFTRAIGRHELSSLQPFDLILLIVIGDLIQNRVTQNDLSVTGILLALCTIGGLQVLTSCLGFRFRRIRPVLQGEPIVLVENGRLIERNMRRERLTPNDLAEKARLSEIETLDEIKWAVLKTTGDISFTSSPPPSRRLRMSGPGSCRLGASASFPGHPREVTADRSGEILATTASFTTCMCTRSLPQQPRQRPSASDLLSARREGRCRRAGVA